MAHARLNDPALYAAGPKGAWLVLRTLHHLQAAPQDRAWMRYLGQPRSGRARGHHIVDITPSSALHHRLLHSREVPWWGRGLAAGHGHPGVLDGLVSERPPRLLSAEETAAKLGLSESSVRAMFRYDQLYPIYVTEALGDQPRIRRRVLADEIAARLGRNLERWEALRALLPDPVRLEPRQVHVRLSPTPWPVDPTFRSPQRQREALSIGHEAGWFQFRQQRGNDVSFTVELADGSVLLHLPARAVLPWLLGVGDAHGAGHLVAYREGLG